MKTSIWSPGHEWLCGLLKKIREKKAIDDEIKAELQKVLKEAKEKFKAERGRTA